MFKIGYVTSTEGTFSDTFLIVATNDLPVEEVFHACLACSIMKLQNKIHK